MVLYENQESAWLGIRFAQDWALRLLPVHNGCLSRLARPVQADPHHIVAALEQFRGDAGVPVLAAVSRPTSLAIQLADQANLTLVGLLRGRSANVYSHPARLGLKPSLR